MSTLRKLDVSTKESEPQEDRQDGVKTSVFLLFSWHFLRVGDQRIGLSYHPRLYIYLTFLVSGDTGTLQFRVFYVTLQYQSAYMQDRHHHYLSIKILQGSAIHVSSLGIGPRHIPPSARIDAIIGHVESNGLAREYTGSSRMQKREGLPQKVIAYLPMVLEMGRLLCKTRGSDFSFMKILQVFKETILKFFTEISIDLSLHEKA